MIVRYLGKTMKYWGTTIVQGKLYRAEYIGTNAIGWDWYSFRALDSDYEFRIPYVSTDGFYANWQPMEEVPMECVGYMCCSRFTCPYCKMR